MVEIRSSQVGTAGVSCQLGVLMKRVQSKLLRRDVGILEQDSELRTQPRYFTPHCVNI